MSSSPAAPAVQAESCEGMGEEETRAYVADLVSQQLGVPGFHLDPQQVPGGCALACGARGLRLSLPPLPCSWW